MIPAQFVFELCLLIVLHRFFFFVSAGKYDLGKTWAIFLRLISLKSISSFEEESFFQTGGN